MQTEKVRGLVLRTVDIKESDRLLSVFTEQKGVMTVLARGARSLKSRKMSSTMQFCYSDFVLTKIGDKYTVKEADLIESFFGLAESIEALALANYIVEVLSFVTVEESEMELLRLSLNALYAAANLKYPTKKIKAAFEMRCAAILGFMPDVLACKSCEGRTGDFFFDIMGGTLECAACRAEADKRYREPENPHEAHILCPLSEGAKTALGYSVHAPLERLFSFKISDEDMHLFSHAAEEYLTNQLETTFRSLEFYKEVCR